MMHSRSLFAFSVCALALVGCGSQIDLTGGGGGAAGAGGGQAGAGGTPTSSGEGGGGAEPGTTTLSAQMGPITIQPGEESVKCIVVDLGNAEDVFVRKFRTTLHEGSHHMIVYTTTEPPNATPFPCQSFGVAGGSAIFIAEQAHSELAMPIDASGVPVGLPLKAHQSLTLEIHYINATGAPIDVLGKVEMDVLPLSADIIKSGFSFLGELGLPVIPAHSEADTGVLFANALPGTKVFALTTHQHHLGTQMQVWRASNTSDLSESIANSLSWSDPPLELYDPPLEFPADGSKGFAYQCHWKNPTDQDVYGGLSANDEMCFFWNYYYPAAF